MAVDPYGGKKQQQILPVTWGWVVWLVPIDVDVTGAPRLHATGNPLGKLLGSPRGASWEA